MDKKCVWESEIWAKCVSRIFQRPRILCIDDRVMICGCKIIMFDWGSKIKNHLSHSRVAPASPAWPSQSIPEVRRRGRTADSCESEEFSSWFSYHERSWWAFPLYWLLLEQEMKQWHHKGLTKALGRMRYILQDVLWHNRCLSGCKVLTEFTAKPGHRVDARGSLHKLMLTSSETWRPSHAARARPPRTPRPCLK